MEERLVILLYKKTVPGLSPSRNCLFVRGFFVRYFIPQPCVLFQVLFFFCFFCDIFESFIAMATIHYHVFETDGSRVYRWSMTSMLFFSSEERKGLCGQEEQRLRRSSGQLRAQHHQGLWHTSHHRQGGRCRPQQSQNRWQSTRRQEDVQQCEQNWQDVKDFVSCSFWQL